MITAGYKHDLGHMLRKLTYLKNFKNKYISL